MRLTLASGLVLATLIGVAPHGVSRAELPPEPSADSGYAVETVCAGLQVPWAIAFVPGTSGDMFITERPGRVRLFRNGKLLDAPVFTVPDVRARAGAEIGLMGMCLHPEFEKNGWLYLAFGHTGGDIRVVRYKYVGSGEADPGDAPPAANPGTLTDPHIIVRGISAGPNHAGCRVRFGPDGKLYITTGEMFRGELAQDMTSLNGKILRVNDDGSVPEDNPFVGEEHKAKGVRPEIWTFGHRNPQGIDWQPGTGLLFSTEHGPSGEAGQGGDEFNLVEKGRNYGWPVIHHDQARDGMESPLRQWTPAIAPASGSFYAGDKFPAWKGDFFVGALGGLAGRRTPGILRITLDGRKYASEERLVTDLGRIREVVAGSDGYIYFTTSNRDGRGRPAGEDDRVLRLVPVKKE